MSEIGKQLSSKAAAAKDDDDTKAKPKSESPAAVKPIPPYKASLPTFNVSPREFNNFYKRFTPS